MTIANQMRQTPIQANGHSCLELEVLIIGLDIPYTWQWELLIHHDYDDKIVLQVYLSAKWQGL